ncbi:MAG: TlpA disulfide reductase family protein [Nitriliruptoraceae bacterium]
MRLLGPLLAAGALLLVACSGGASAASGCEQLPGVRPGLCPIPVEDREPAPVDRLPVVGGQDEVGGPDELGLEAFAGQVVIVNFWASWCGPCRVEQPDLNAAHELLPADEVAFLGVNIEDAEPNALAHIREFEIPYPSLFDPANDYASRFSGVGPRNIPSTLFIDREGRVAVRVFGVIGTRETTSLAALLADEV